MENAIENKILFGLFSSTDKNIDYNYLDTTQINLRKTCNQLL